MGKICLILLGTTAFLFGIFTPIGARAFDEALEREQQARYYINYAGYLIDVGKYLEALESYEAAEEVTALPKTRIDALLGKASLLSSFLDAPEEALKVYRDIRRGYSQAAEIAQYREGFLLFDMRNMKEAESTLKEYLKAYPEGKFRYQTEALLSEIAKAPRPGQAAMEAPVPAVPETTTAFSIASAVPETEAAVAPSTVVPEATALPKPRETTPSLSEFPAPRVPVPQPVMTEPVPVVPPSSPATPEQKTLAPPSAIVFEETASTPAATPVPETTATAALSKVAPEENAVPRPLKTAPPLSESPAPRVPAPQPVATEPAPAAPSIPAPPFEAPPVTEPRFTPAPSVTVATAPSSLTTAAPVMERESPDVRVRMCKTTGETRLEGTRICAAGMDCLNRIALGIKNGKILVNGSQVSANVLRFESETPITIVCGSNRKQVRGKVSAETREGSLLVVNVVAIEDYLMSVVPSENPASWPLESLKSQAVAARTYAYYQLLHRKDWAYDLVDHAGDQAYGGMAKEHPRSTEAVKATTGEVLVYDNKPILAMFSANSGGHTADSASVFSLHKPYLLAQKDPASLKGSMANWTKKYTVSEVVSALRKINIDAKGLKEIEAAEKGPSGRVIKVRLVQSDGNTQVLRNRTTLRRALDLPEILHGIHRDGDTFIFEGHGWGHGVGYSQWGAAHLGKEKKYTEILSFYYGSAKIEKRW